MAIEKIEGVVATYGAARMHDETPAYVSVWDADGVVLFKLPLDSNAQHINSAIGIHEKSYRDGMHFGALEVRNEMRKLRGLNGVSEQQG